MTQHLRVCEGRARAASIIGSSRLVPGFRLVEGVPRSKACNTEPRHALSRSLLVCLTRVVQCFCLRLCVQTTLGLPSARRVEAAVLKGCELGCQRSHPPPRGHAMHVTIYRTSPCDVRFLFYYIAGLGLRIWNTGIGRCM